MLMAHSESSLRAKEQKKDERKKLDPSVRSCGAWDLAEGATGRSALPLAVMVKSVLRRGDFSSWL